ncbi:MAG: hypothetical protein M1830_009311 [Pleopsidium flavum]|nr:MAG: hypothetical protein M1830_009311 [Pleopsidium flavum]
MATSLTPKNPLGATTAPRVPKFRASCDNCHSLKVRCGQEKPNCVRCGNHSVDCVYGISRRMGKPKGGSRAVVGSTNSGKRPRLSSPTDKKRPADLPVAGLRSQSPLNLVQTPPQLERMVGSNPSNLNPSLSLSSHSSTYPTWQDYPWSVAPYASHLVYPTSGMDERIEVCDLPISWARSGSTPMDNKHPSSSSSSKSSASSDLDLDVRAQFINLQSEDTTSWWNYCNSSGMGAVSPEVSDLFKPPNGLVEVPLLPPTDPLSAQIRFSAPSVQSFLTGGLHESCAIPCTHYLSLLQTLATLEKGLHAPHPQPTIFHESPDIEAVRFNHTRSIQALPNHHWQAKSSHLDLSFDQILALAKGTLAQSSDIFQCEACLSDSSCLLMFAVLIEKLLWLYQAGAKAYGICNDYRPQNAHQQHGHFPRNPGGHREIMENQPVAACQTSKICVGKHELDPAEERVLVKNLVMSRLKEMADILDRLSSAIGSLPDHSLQASACHNALGHAWGKLRFVSGIVEVY